MSHFIYYKYLNLNDQTFFTIVLLPNKTDKFPVVIKRSPYVKQTINETETNVLNDYYNSSKHWIDHGYAVIFQHCRGTGKSSGDFVPYLYEREDGIALRDWVRKQSFYNGEIFLVGGSYTASLHYATIPFEEDIKGAVLEVQDSERYRLWYRNGQMRKGHANWFFELYKNKSLNKKNFNISSFSQLPLKGFSERFLGECVEDFEKMLEAYNPFDDFWLTRIGGIDTKDAMNNIDIPVLLTTGYNDFYIGGVFEMWNSMPENLKKESAMLVSPYNHGDSFDSEFGLDFPNGKRIEFFGPYYQIGWFDNIRNNIALSYEKGSITYYRTFENIWATDFYGSNIKDFKILLGEGTKTFVYDPKSPPSFRGEGLCTESLEGRDDVITIFTPTFKNDTFIKGKMKIKLSVSSNCPDTSIYVRISIKKGNYSYVLRHDITSFIYQLGFYNVGEIVELDFSFDEYAFLVKKGEKLQIDISSTDYNTYISHTNNFGEYYLQVSTNVAFNKIHLDKSYIVIPVESDYDN